MSDMEYDIRKFNNPEVIITIPEDAMVPDPNPSHRSLLRQCKIVSLRNKKLCAGVVTMLIMDVIIIVGIMCIPFVKLPSKWDRQQSKRLPNGANYVPPSGRNLGNIEGNGLPLLAYSADGESGGLPSVQSSSTEMSDNDWSEATNIATLTTRITESEGDGEPLAQVPDSDPKVDTGDSDRPNVEPYRQIARHYRLDTPYASDTESIDRDHEAKTAPGLVIQHGGSESSSDEESMAPPAVLPARPVAPTLSGSPVCLSPPALQPQSSCALLEQQLKSERENRLAWQVTFLCIQRAHMEIPYHAFREYWISVRMSATNIATLTTRITESTGYGEPMIQVPDLDTAVDSGHFDLPNLGPHHQIARDYPSHTPSVSNSESSTDEELRSPEAVPAARPVAAASSGPSVSVPPLALPPQSSSALLVPPSKSEDSWTASKEDDKLAWDRFWEAGNDRRAFQRAHPEIMFLFTFRVSALNCVFDSGDCNRPNVEPFHQIDWNHLSAAPLGWDPESMDRDHEANTAGQKTMGMRKDLSQRQTSSKEMMSEERKADPGIPHHFIPENGKLTRDSVQLQFLQLLLRRESPTLSTFEQSQKQEMTRKVMPRDEEAVPDVQRPNEFRRDPPRGLLGPIDFQKMPQNIEPLRLELPLRRG